MLVTSPAAMRPLPYLFCRRARPALAALLRSPGFAVAAVLVWLLGVELGPGLHIARHGALGHHHHGAAEALACAAHHEGGHAADGHDDAGPAHHEHDAAPAHHAEPAHHEHHAEPAHHEHHAEPAHHEPHAEPAHHEHHAAPAHHERVEHGLLATATAVLAPPPAEPAGVAQAPGAVPHGSGSLAHRDLVPLTPPLALPPILSAPWQPLELSASFCAAPRERTPDVLRARGPPIGARTPEPSSVV
jgi:hypothetical protein